MEIIKFLNYIKEEKEWASRLDDPYEEENWEEESIDVPYKYDTSIEIGRSINPRKDVYKIVISNMHGDADAYTENVVYKNKKEEVIEIINFIDWAAYKTRGNHREQYEISEVSAKMFGSEDAYYDWIDSDSTCDGQYLCHPTIKSVTYFDKEGAEHVVNIKQKKIK
jgi:hypothetical protein